eukprot:3111994-Rhodomonas_salina.2
MHKHAVQSSVRRYGRLVSRSHIAYLIAYWSASTGTGTSVLAYSLRYWHVWFQAQTKAIKQEDRRARWRVRRKGLGRGTDRQRGKEGGGREGERDEKIGPES